MNKRFILKCSFQNVSKLEIIDIIDKDFFLEQLLFRDLWLILPIKITNILFKSLHLCQKSNRPASTVCSLKHYLSKVSMRKKRTIKALFAHIKFWLG